MRHLGQDWNAASINELETAYENFEIVSIEVKNKHFL